MEKGGIPPTGVYTMKETPARPLPHIGLRNLKTALSASLCALIYFFLNRNPAFACIGAIFGMGADMDHSKLHGGNRLFGTVIGGFLGIGLYRIYLVFYPDGGRHLLLVPLLFGGIVVLILLAQIFWVGAVQPGGVVLCLLLFSIGRTTTSLTLSTACWTPAWGWPCPCSSTVCSPGSGWTPGRKSSAPCGTGARRAAEGSGPYDTGSFRP